MIPLDFNNVLQALMSEAREIADKRGYFEHPIYLLPVVLSHRVIEEVMEWAEVYARGQMADFSDKIPGFTKSEEEWADCVIKLMRVGGHYGYNPAAVRAKLRYELTRVTTRGGKVF